jgi:hypothetical protein
MRKYLVATAIGAMLIASQAAATDSALLTVGDRTDLQGDGGGGWTAGQSYIALSAIVLAGLLIWGFTEGGHGHPASP